VSASTPIQAQLAMANYREYFESEPYRAHEAHSCVFVSPHWIKGIVSCKGKSVRNENEDIPKRAVD
jgi:hypothetical protein